MNFDLSSDQTHRRLKVEIRRFPVLEFHVKWLLQASFSWYTAAKNTGWSEIPSIALQARNYQFHNLQRSQLARHPVYRLLALPR